MPAFASSRRTSSWCWREASSRKSSVRGAPSQGRPHVGILRVEEPQRVVGELPPVVFPERARLRRDVRPERFSERRAPLRRADGVERHRKVAEAERLQETRTSISGPLPLRPGRRRRAAPRRSARTRGSARPAAARTGTAARRTRDAAASGRPRGRSRPPRARRRPCSRDAASANGPSGRRSVYISLWTMSVVSPTERAKSAVSSRIGVRISP